MRQVTTRKGDLMAILKLEDLTGTCDAIVFPKTFQRLSEFLMVETRLLLWGSVDRRDENIQLIVDDCRAIDDLRVLMVDLLPEQASDIKIQHRLRECLYKHRPNKDEFGVKVPVVAAIRNNSNVHYVRLGHQFCVRDADNAINYLQQNSFNASFSESLLKVA